MGVALEKIKFVNTVKNAGKFKQRMLKGHLVESKSLFTY